MQIATDVKTRSISKTTKTGVWYYYPIVAGFVNADGVVFQPLTEKLTEEYFSRLLNDIIGQPRQVKSSVETLSITKDKTDDLGNETLAKNFDPQNGATGQKGKLNDVPLPLAVAFREDNTCQLKSIGIPENDKKISNDKKSKEKRFLVCPAQIVRPDGKP